MNNIDFINIFDYNNAKKSLVNKYSYVYSKYILCID